VKYKSKRSPSEFLRSFFLSQPSASASSWKKRSSSRKSHSTITSTTFLPRSSSNPSELAASGPNLFNPSDQSHSGTPTTTSSSPLLGPVRNRDEQHSEVSFNTTPDTVRRRAKTRPPVAKALADSDSAIASPFTPLALPRAVVISGLEHVGLPAQRAFMQMLVTSSWSMFVPGTNESVHLFITACWTDSR